MDRRTFLQRGAVLGGGLIAAGPLHAFGARVAMGAQPERVTGYGPLVPKGDLALPAEFNYQVISRQFQPQTDGTLTPGIFDGMAAFPGPQGTTILIRNHENRRRPGEFPVVVPPGLRYDEDPSYNAGCTKLRVKQTRRGQAASYEVVESFNILGSTSTNCAGGETPFKSWITCEEVVDRSAVSGKKHGYNFEVDAMADGPVKALPILAAGRFVHEATTWLANIYYQTEDRALSADPVLGTIGACFYRWIPDKKIGQSGNLAQASGPLQALKLKDEVHANMDTGRVVGRPYPVEWVTVDEPDHDDDTDNRRDRVPGFTPTRIQAQDKGAAYFDRMEGMWEGRGKIYFDCTTGGAQNLGQVWEYDPGRETVTLIYESVSPQSLQNPDNIVIVPKTGDIFLQEDGPDEDGQYIRGLTQDGEIYDFARSLTNNTEFCGGCFDPDGQTLYVNQQGERGGSVDAPPAEPAVTYAIYGPFEKRQGNNSRSFGNGSNGR